jgi:hypothetical protein
MESLIQLIEAIGKLAPINLALLVAALAIVSAVIIVLRR